MVIPCLMLGWFVLPLVAMAQPEILPGWSGIGRKGGLATTLSFAAMFLSYGLAWLVLTIAGAVVAAIVTDARSVDQAERDGLVRGL